MNGDGYSDIIIGAFIMTTAKQMKEEHLSIMVHQADYLQVQTGQPRVIRQVLTLAIVFPQREM